MAETPTAAPPSFAILRVYTLGHFAVYRGDDLIDEAAWKRQKAKKLFKLLLLAPQRQLLKDRVLELLWPDKSPQTAANNLHRTLFVLRRVLQPDLDSATASHYLWFKDDLLMLNPACIGWVDLEAFERLIQLGQQQAHNFSHYHAAIELYRGEFLPEDRYEDWAEERRGSLQASYAALLKLLATLYCERFDYPRAIESLCALLRLDPTDEAVQRDLMRCYVQVGERHKALRLYQQACRVLRDELGIAPSAETVAIYEAILNESRVLTSALPKPVSSLDDAERTPLVGRQSELGQLSRVLEQARQGHGTIICLVGQQGVGKTRLAEELAARARASGVTTLYGTAYEGEGQLLYAPYVGILRQGLTTQMLEPVRARLGPLVKDLARLLPELERLAPLPMPAAAPSSRLEIETGEQERRRLFEAVATTYAVFAQRSPLLVVLDNLHATGESSLQLLHYLARQISGHPILFVTVVEQDKLQRGSRIAFLLNELQRNQLAQRLNLSALGRDAIAQLCVHLTDESMRASTIPDVIFERTEGNPFFARELLLSLLKSGHLARERQGWRLLDEGLLIVPSSIQETIGVRLGQLSEPAYRLLSVAAVLGNGFTYESLQAASQLSRSAMLDTFEDLLDEALIEPTESGYRFQHAMIRQAIYHSLSAERREWLHEQVANALERLTPDQHDERATVLAYHYEQAGDYVVALRYLVRASDWAHRVGASREALEHYNRAIEIYQRRPKTRVETSALTTVLELRAQTFLTLSEFDAAIGDLDQLLATYQQAGEQSRVGETLYQLGFAHYWAHRLLKAGMYLDQALAVAETIDYHELRNRVLRLRDILNSTQGRMVESVADDDRLPSAANTHTPPEEHWGYAMLAHLRYDFQSAEHHARTCIEVGQARHHTFLTLGGYFIFGMAQASQGKYQSALDTLLVALKLSETTGDRFWRARLLNTIAWIYRDLFSLELAIQHDLASLELARASTPRLTEAEGNALANLAATYVQLGQYDLAQGYIDEGLALAVHEPFMRWRYFSRLLVSQGQIALIEQRLDEAWAAMEKSLELARSTRARKNIARSCLLRGQILQARGDLPKAHLALRHALSVAQNLNSLGMVWKCHLALAALHDADAQSELASLHYQEAAQIVAQIAAGLSDPALRAAFLESRPVRALRHWAEPQPVEQA
jgi:DNA-binding SARP family transcriptional activator